MIDHRLIISLWNVLNVTYYYYTNIRHIYAHIAREKHWSRVIVDRLLPNKSCTIIQVLYLRLSGASHSRCSRESRTELNTLAADGKRKRTIRCLRESVPMVESADDRFLETRKSGVAHGRSVSRVYVRVVCVRARVSRLDAPEREPCGRPVDVTRSLKIAD